MGLILYELTEIQDEAVALSGAIPQHISAKSPVFLLTVLTIMIVSFIIFGAAHSIRVHYYQTRLDELALRVKYEPGEYNRRSVKSIKSQIAILEENIAEGDLGGFVPVV